MYSFFCLRETCYIYMSLSRRPCGLLTVVRPIARQHLQKSESLDPGRAEVRQKEECDGTHANRPETRVFQRRAAKSRHHWLRLRWLAAGAALCRSGAQSHGI